MDGHLHHGNLPSPDNLIEEVSEVLSKEFGEEIKVILENLPEEGLLEEEFFKKIGIEGNVSRIRKLMYKLYEKGIVTFERMEVKRRWWIYKWKMRWKNAIRYVLEKKEQELRELTRLLESERNYKFSCPKCGKKFSYDESLFLGFSCDSCGEILQEYVPNVDREIQERVSRLEEEILMLRSMLESKG